MLFLGQCGQCLIKFTSGMSCAAHHSDAFRQLVVSLVSICMKPAREPVQKFFRVFCFSVFLVLIQNDRMLSTATGAVQPHIGLAGGGTSRFFQHLQGRFVGVQHRLLTKLLAQRIVDWPQPHPQCYQSGVYGCGILPWSPFHSCWHPSPRLR